MTRKYCMEPESYPHFTTRETMNLAFPPYNQSKDGEVGHLLHAVF